MIVVVTNHISSNHISSNHVSLLASLEPTACNTHVMSPTTSIYNLTTDNLNIQPQHTARGMPTCPQQQYHHALFKKAYLPSSNPACVAAYLSSRCCPDVVGGYLGGLSGPQQPGSASTTVSKFGSKKKGHE